MFGNRWDGLSLPQLWQLPFQRQHRARSRPQHRIAVASVLRSLESRRKEEMPPHNTTLVSAIIMAMPPEQITEGQRRAQLFLHPTAAPGSEKADGAEHGSQPMRSETNQTSSAAGSRR